VDVESISSSKQPLFGSPIGYSVYLGEQADRSPTQLHRTRFGSLIFFFIYWLLICGMSRINSVEKKASWRLPINDARTVYFVFTQKKMITDHQYLGVPVTQSRRGKKWTQEPPGTNLNGRVRWKKQNQKTHLVPTRTLLRKTTGVPGQMLETIFPDHTIINTIPAFLSSRISDLRSQTKTKQTS